MLFNCLLNRSWIISCVVGMGALLTPIPIYAGISDVQPNEKVLSTAWFKTGEVAELTIKSNPLTGEHRYSVYVVASSKTTGTASSASTKLLNRKDVFEQVGKNHSKPIQFLIRDANSDGIEELMVHLKGENGKETIGIYTLVEGKVKTLLETSCSGFVQNGDCLRFQSFNFKYGIDQIWSYQLNRKGSITLTDKQCFDLGIRPGIEYEDFKVLMGSGHKKRYDKTLSPVQVGQIRRFDISTTQGVFTFEGPIVDNGKTSYVLSQMTIKGKNARGLGNIAIGDPLGQVQKWLEGYSRDPRIVVVSKFLSSEIQVKMNVGTIGGRTEVWHIKHVLGKVTEMTCRFE